MTADPLQPSNPSDDLRSRRQLLEEMERLRTENRELFVRLEESEEAIRAIRGGEVDAFVVDRNEQQQIYTVEMANRPYRLLVEQMRQGAATVDRTGVILYANSYLGELLEQEAEQLSGRRLQAFIAPEDQARFQSLFDQSQSRQTMDEFLLHTVQGHVVFALIAGRAMLGVPDTLCLIFTDLTERETRKRLEQEVLDRRQAESAQRESEERLKLALRATSTGIWEWNAVEEQLYLSPECFHILELHPAQFRHRPDELFELIWPEDRQRVQAALRDSLEDARALNIEFRTVGGAVPRWVACRAQAFQRDGRIQFLLGTVTDITARKQADADLRASEARVRATFENAAVGIAELTVDGRFASVNSALCSTLRYDCEALTAATLLELTVPEDVEALKADLDRLHSGELDAVSQTIRLVRRDGEMVWAHLAASAVWDDSTFQYIVAIFQDITAQKQAQDQVRESRQRLRTALDASGTGTFRWDMLANVLEWDEELTRLFGRGPGETLHTLSDFAAMVHPDDRNKVLHATGESLAHAADFNLDFRVVWPDGAVHWLDVRGKTFVDEQGRAVNMTGACVDITQRKAAEEERLRLLEILEATPDFVATADASGTTRYLNPAARRIFGLSAYDDVSLASVLAFKGRGSGQFVPETIVPVAARDGVWTGESAIIDKDGNLVPISQVVLAHKDDMGRVRFFSTVARDISERKLTEQKLREREARVRMAGLAAGMGFWLWNPATDEIEADVRTAELFGAPHEEFTTGQAAFTRIDPLDCQRVERDLDRLLAEGAAISQEFRVHLPDGSIRWLIGQGGLFTRGGQTWVTGVNFDITAQKQLEATLRESEQHLRRVIDNLFAFVGVLTLDGTLIEANRAPLDAAELRHEDVLGKKFWDTWWWSYSTESQSRLIEAVERCRRGEVVRCDTQVRVAGNRLVTLDFMLAPLRDSEGRITHLIPSGVDITDRKQTEAKLAAAKVAADAANLAKSEFLATMSHEIRTPMTAVLGFSEILRTQLTSAEHLQSLDANRRNGEHLLTLINDILDLSKVEAGKIELNFSTASVSELLVSLDALMQVRAQDKGVKLQFDCITNIPETITTDVLRLRQVLVNLIGNAIKFTEEGRVDVRVACHEEGGKANLAFQVIDTGVGMTEEQQQRLFHPFMQADASVTHRFGGTGLGLAISKRLAEMLGGTIHFSSRAGEGSEFTFTVPVGRIQQVKLVHWRPEPPSEDAGKAPPAAPPRDVHGRVLLADDRRDVWMVARYFLERAGAEVVVAQNGEEALQMVIESESDSRPFSLIFMDMQMPVLDGAAAVAELRSRGCQTPIIALTADAMEGSRERYLGIGCDDVFTKPIDGGALVEIAQRYISARRFATRPK